MRILVLWLISTLWGGTSYGCAAAQDVVPDVLKTWIPWVLHGHETIACPPAHDDATVRQCAWPSELDLDLKAGGGSFRLRAEAFARQYVDRAARRCRTLAAGCAIRRLRRWR